MFSSVVRFTFFPFILSKQIMKPNAITYSPVVVISDAIPVFYSDFPALGTYVFCVDENATSPLHNEIDYPKWSTRIIGGHLVNLGEYRSMVSQWVMLRLCWSIYSYPCYRAFRYQYNTGRWVNIFAVAHWSMRRTFWRLPIVWLIKAVVVYMMHDR